MNLLLSQTIRNTTNLDWNLKNIFAKFTIMAYIALFKDIR